MSSSLIVLLALIVIVAGVAYLVIERQRQQQTKQPLEAESREWLVQCPSCLRWKEMPPIASDQGDFTHEDGEVALQPGGKYKFHNQYKCPFCGHRWEEEYLE